MKRPRRHLQERKPHIDANLGAPWIPERDIQAFAADLFHVEPSSVPVAHLKKDAVWSIAADYAAQQSVAATSDYGTTRASGTNLLELALNMKTPVLYDTINHGDREERVVNQEATLAAREKQRLIKERFRCWIFSDPDCTELHHARRARRNIYRCQWNQRLGSNCGILLGWQHRPRFFARPW
jgi:N12 class adenine-specific DNA methylase